MKIKKLGKIKKQTNIRMTKEIEIIPIDKLTLWEENPRINETAAIKLAALIKEYGFVTPITVDQNNVIRKGNTGYKAAKLLGMTELPAVRVPYKEGKAITYGISDNRSGEWASWDEEILYNLTIKKEVLEFTESKERLAAVTGFSNDEIRNLHFDPDIDKLQNIKPSDSGIRAVIRVKCEPVDKDRTIQIIVQLAEMLASEGITAEII